MNKDEFVSYVRGVIDLEIENSKNKLNQLKQSENIDFELVGALKLIKEALDKLETQVKYR